MEKILMMAICSVLLQLNLVAAYECKELEMPVGVYGSGRQRTMGPAYDSRSRLGRKDLEALATMQNPESFTLSVSREAQFVSHDLQKVAELALKRDSKPLTRPKVGLIAAGDVRKYPYVDRYLTELGNAEITHYYVLREDYVFEDLNGCRCTIPAGFIWDGASIPKQGLVPLLLETGNTRYSSALCEGLIHDWMYRNPMKYSKEDADMLFYVNAVRCKNSDPLRMYLGVRESSDAAVAYAGHLKRQREGDYAVFTPEFYAENISVYQSCNDSQKPEVFDRDLQCKKGDDPADRTCRADSGVAKKLKVVDTDKDTDKKSDVDSTGKVGVRGWCKCGGKKGDGCCCGYGAILGASAVDCPYAYLLCRHCGKCMRDPDNLIDVKLEEALQKAKHMTSSQMVAERKKAQDRLLAIPDGQIVFPGKCVCEASDVIKVGRIDNKEFYVCLLCGRCYVPVGNTIPIGPTARKEMGLK